MGTSGSLIRIHLRDLFRLMLGTVTQTHSRGLCCVTSGCLVRAHSRGLCRLIYVILCSWRRCIVDGLHIAFPHLRRRRSHPLLDKRSSVNGLSRHPRAILSFSLHTCFIPRVSNDKRMTALLIQPFFFLVGSLANDAYYFYVIKDILVYPTCSHSLRPWITQNICEARHRQLDC